ncbi:hypothetical protein PVAND_004159 [Polypedilum vanderplanki]|uniref:Uncharacterized protein n=1 Tax=Polypedilum vanderplanki TaxID=319348 RepID=A0A9J6BWV2_POLVA|nr:hypothetical protein PVAND_004159 [Polypedilum vanderplanki]
MRSMDATQFKHLAKTIVDLYPTEVTATYYIPGLKKKSPGGKLYSQYNNYRTKLDAVGLCFRKKNQNVSGDPRNSIENAEVTEDVIVDAMQVIKSLNWNDTALFYECWNMTFDERQRLLATEIGVLQYINSFPYLRQVDVGYDVIALDGRKKYPSLADDKKEMFLKISPFIMQKLQNVKSEPMVVNLIRKYSHSNGQTKALLALSLIPFLFRPVIIGKRKKGNTGDDITKASKSHAYRNFFSNFETHEEMINYRNKVGCTGNLALYSIGNLNENPHALITIGDVEYVLTDCFKGFQNDICIRH